MLIEDKEVLILGGGVCGLAAASVLGNRAVVVERNARPGGLVRSNCYAGYWFDHVLHLLHFNDTVTQRRIEQLLGPVLAWCPPEAWVEISSKVVRYPFQMHLRGLGQETVIRCLRDLAEVTFRTNKPRPNNFEELLGSTFGKAMCEEFLFPYNEKIWKRPLSTLAPIGFQWTITHPDFEQVLQGALTEDPFFKSYNSNGWYPRPPLESPVRGMEVLSRALAKKAMDLRLQHTVESIDLESRTVVISHPQGKSCIRYRRCCSTIPLPNLISICRQSPDYLQESMHKLTRNAVITVALCIQGARPENTGHWRYYSDPELVFTRLVYMHAFDPNTAPPDGWGLMAEITQRAEDGVPSEKEILDRVSADVERAGALPQGCKIIGRHVMHIDPAYVVFTTTNGETIEQAREFLKLNNVTPLGRYGHWEYSSMFQVMRDGFEWAESLTEEISQCP